MVVTVLEVHDPFLGPVQYFNDGFLDSRLHCDHSLEVTMSEQFLSTVDLAARQAMSSKALTRWRGKRRGPPFVKLGGAVRYAMSEVLEFERSDLRKPSPRQVGPDEPTPPEIIQNLTVRGVVAVLRADVQ